MNKQDMVVAEYQREARILRLLGYSLIGDALLGVSVATAKLKLNWAAVELIILYSAMVATAFWGAFRLQRGKNTAAASWYLGLVSPFMAGTASLIILSFTGILPNIHKVPPWRLAILMSAHGFVVWVYILAVIARFRSIRARETSDRDN